MKVLGIDPGEKNIGIAISDPTGTLSRPLKVITHISKRANAERILEIAQAENVGLIIIGQLLIDHFEYRSLPPVGCFGRLASPSLVRTDRSSALKAGISES